MDSRNQPVDMDTTGISARITVDRTNKNTIQVVGSRFDPYTMIVRRINETKK